MTFAALLVVSLVAIPALQPEPAQAASTPRTTSPLEAALQDDSEPEPVGPNLTDPGLLPEERLGYAALRIDAVDVDGATRRDRLNASFEHLNDSLANYDTHRATDRAAFDEQAEALHSLARATEDDEHAGRFENVSLGVLRAGEQTALIATRHANQSRHRFASSLDQWDQSDVEQALSDARAALDRAETARDRISENWTVSRRIRQRGDVVDHYREANHHANRALDTVAANAEPRLRLSQGQGFQVNETTVAVSVEAALTDVRPWTYENATVTAESDVGTAEAPPIEFEESWMTGSFATGRTMVRFDADAENVTVNATARDPANPGRSANATLTLNLSRVVRNTGVPAPSGNVTVTDEESGASVAVRGDNLTRRDVRVTDETPAATSDVHASPVIRAVNHTAVDDATVRLPLSPGVDPSANLSMYTWDPSTNETWTQVETTIDAQNRTATAEVDHFSFFAVFRVEPWEAVQSSTITLQDRHIAGNRTNGTAASRVDLVFVMDESGSMGGAPIDFSKQAAKRFVGALFDDERAGVVGYDGSASRDQQLTTDHDAVNASIDSLTAGGGTATEAGIRTGLSEFDQNGLSNRSDLMILLSDGVSNSGSFPRDAARDAADQGVEISTVGLGSGINEDELRDVANITGGDFYHVQDAEDLPDTFERVAAERAGPALRDSSGDGIPDAVADANPVIPDLVPLEGEEAARIGIDTFERDTSGDGILDNETIEVDWRTFEEDNETKLEAAVVDAEHHPNRTDTSGNGLDDRLALAGWTARFTNSTNRSETYVRTVQQVLDQENPDPSILDDAERHLEVVDVTAEPMVADTDGDGVSDYEERNLSSHPRRSDTTGDGIDDDHARRSDAADPTLYDVQGPDIDVFSASYHSPPLSFVVEYVTTFHVFDPAGVSEARVQLDGDTQTTHQVDGLQGNLRSEFQTDGLASINDALTGSTVKIQAEDANGNLAEEVALERTNIYGEAADRISGAGFVGAPLASRLGMLSGIATGAGEFAEFLAALASNPLEFIPSVQQIVDVITNLGAIISALPAAIDRRQASLNPYDPDQESALYQAYRGGWYGGYATWLVLEIAFPLGETLRIVRSSSRFQRAVRALDSSGRLVRLGRAAASMASTAYAPVRMLNYALAQLVLIPLSVTVRVAQKLLRGLTAGAKLTQAKLLRALDGDTARALTDEELSEVDGSLRRATREAAQDDVVESFDQIDRAVAQIEEFSGVARTRAAQLLADSPGPAVKLLDEVDEATLRRIMEYDGEDARFVRQNVAERYASGTVNEPQVTRFSHNLEDLRDVDGFEQAVAERVGRAGDASNVKGLLWQSRVATEIVDPADIRRFEMDIDPVEFDDLSQSQIDRLVDEIGWQGEDALSRQAQEDLIREALGDGGELDVVTREGVYLEAKATRGATQYQQILEQMIRYKTVQMTEDLGPTNRMEVVAPDDAFTDLRDGSPNKVARLVDDSDDVDRQTMEKLTDASSNSAAARIGTPDALVA